MKLITQNTVPKLQLKEHLQLDEEFRNEYNQYLLDRFGYYEIPDDKVYIFEDNLIGSPRAIYNIKEFIRNEEIKLNNFRVRPFSDIWL